MREHLKAVNHQEIVDFISDLAQKRTSTNEHNLLSTDNLILRGIQPLNAEKYRKNNVIIDDNTYLVSK